LVVRLSVVWVVPAARVPDGRPLERTGAVVSAGWATAKAIVKSLVLALAAASWQRTKKL
jgi:hypothetical protein